MSALLRRFGGWLLALAERFERQARQSAAEDPRHEVHAQSRVFELRTRIHAGYY